MVGAGTIGIFMHVSNEGGRDDALVGCSLLEHPDARGELHTVVDGLMQEIEEIVVPAGGAVGLEPGSYHLMFFGLPGELGETLTVVLEFRISKSKTVSVQVKKPDTGP
jgi:hypothetical protein